MQINGRRLNKDLCAGCPHKQLPPRSIVDTFDKVSCDTAATFLALISIFSALHALRDGEERAYQEPTRAGEKLRTNVANTTITITITNK